MDNQIIDTSFDFWTETFGDKPDPDSQSQTLRKYHKILWNKPLPDGKTFELTYDSKGYFYHKSDKQEEFRLSSDAITNSYKNYKHRKDIQMILEQIPNEVDELRKACSIGCYILFPNNKIDGQPTINMERGTNPNIFDRFDLTLECIRRFYSNKEGENLDKKDFKNPLYETLKRYENFFDLFVDFEGYVKFFLLEDLVNEDKSIKFYLPFDNFANPPKFDTVEDYLIYKNGVLAFYKSKKQKNRKLYSRKQ